ncbi:hypothetical protein M595_2017 [Lyngbya aestuarii BL J]|uniref:Uncharacterized protein n=1 Tax=Lyngbya aestuarii BL J TaxID=1348334 RepID=U7QJ85_9CYAN|nr:hypothetical protein [Lyngbya aestuarii]ERT08019.1 hypothetical protein M595_2017 [Lyngbya aestuarii BL J]
MLHAKYKITWNSGQDHPYKDDMTQIQNQFLSALVARLLKRLIEEQQTSIEQQLNCIYNNWNCLKEHTGFKKHKNIAEPFITSSRHFLLFQNLFEIFLQASGDLLNYPLIDKCLDKIPKDLSAEILDELLDRFMKEEQYRCSPEDRSPFLMELERSQSASETSEANEKIEENRKPPSSPEELELLIEKFQKEKQVKFSHLTYKKSEVEAKLSKVQNEFSEVIHNILVSLYKRRTEETLITEYIDTLNNDLKSYGKRPVYKLALRIRNILVLSHFKGSVTFPKNIIENIVKNIAKVFGEELEICFAVHFAKSVTSKEELYSYVKNTVDPILYMIQNTLINNPISIEIPESIRDDDIVSNQYARLLKELQIYTPIPLEEFLISETEEIYLQIINFFTSTNDFEELRANLLNIFIRAAKKIASSQSIKLNQENFEKDFFHRNSFNILLEFSRLFLGSIKKLSPKELSVYLRQSLSNLSCFSKLFFNLDSQFSPLVSWTVYLPIDGIKVPDKVPDNFPRCFFPELNSSVSELYEVKFLSIKILDSISIESTMKIMGDPILMSSAKADACAVIGNIRARNGYQAATSAITILLETIESQLFFMNYGYQYQIKLHRRSNTTAICFCKKDNIPGVEYPWSICTIPLAGWRGTTKFDFTEQTEKLFALPGRFFKILSDRAKRNDALGSLAQDLIHCIKLYRQGFFSEGLAERFRLYWTILDTILLPENTPGKAIHLIPYRVSMFCLGMENLIENDDSYTYEQVRLWMREDIEDFYTLVRNPLIHKGIDHAPAYERLLERVESIVNLVLNRIGYYVIYMPIPEDFLEEGLDGIISFLEQLHPGGEAMQSHC